MTPWNLWFDNWMCRNGEFVCLHLWTLEKPLRTDCPRAFQAIIKCHTVSTSCSLTDWGVTDSFSFPVAAVPLGPRYTTVGRPTASSGPIRIHSPPLDQDRLHPSFFLRKRWNISKSHLHGCQNLSFRSSLKNQLESLIILKYISFYTALSLRVFLSLDVPTVLASTNLAPSPPANNPQICDGRQLGLKRTWKLPTAPLRMQW